MQALLYRHGSLRDHRRSAAALYQATRETAFGGYRMKNDAALIAAVRFCWGQELPKSDTNDLTNEVNQSWLELVLRLVQISKGAGLC